MDNPEGAKFCLDCGAKLGVVCPLCGTGLPTEAKFCLECGARVRPSPTAPKEEPGVRGLVPRRVQGLDKAIQRLVPEELAERLLSSGGQVAGERRIVTILFSDVKGSTAMAEGWTPRT
jgi:hypothetical protein